MQALLLLLLISAAAVFGAHQIANLKGRSAPVWMWAAALFPPTVVILALLPSRNAGSAGVAA